MSGIGEFQDRVNDLIGLDTRFQIDRPHAGKPQHVDLTHILPEIGGADKVAVDLNGAVLGGLTRVGPIKMGW